MFHGEVFYLQKERARGTKIFAIEYSAKLWLNETLKITSTEEASEFLNEVPLKIRSGNAAVETWGDFSVPYFLVKASGLSYCSMEL
jgi:hypothetical protein